MPQGEGTLADLKAGQAGIVSGISAECRGFERRRLMDLGIVRGTLVVPELTSPSGGLRAYRIRQSLFALRNEQARLIRVQVVQAFPPGAVRHTSGPVLEDWRRLPDGAAPGDPERDQEGSA